MGQKQGKHRREDGTEEPSEETSPKRSSPKRSSKGRKKSKESPTRESPTREPPVQQVEVQEKMDQPKALPKSEGTPSKKTTSSSVSPKKKETTFDVTKELTIDTSFDNKENNKNISSQVTPIKQTKTQIEPVTPLQNATNHIPGPQATSTPAPNGMVNGPSVSPPLSPGSTTDQSQGESDDEGMSPTEGQFRSLSPTISLVSRSTTSSMPRIMSDSGSMSRGAEVNFGKFYNTSYLRDSATGYLKRPASNPTQAQRSPNFARPENFTYSMEPPAWMKQKKGMSALASGQGKKVVKVPATSPVDLKNEEPVKLSMYPAARPPQPNEITKIEREDWPGPPSPAALLPEILRERKKSRGLKDDDDDDDVELLPHENPQVKREIEELSKLDAKSSIAQAILKSLEERKVIVPSPLDPWKASRVPNASYEPRYRTRYQSPMFASPSRFLDRPRPRSWDDSDLRGYRSLSASRFPNYPAPKPGYGGWAPKSVTLPLEGAYGGQLDYRFFEFDDSDQPDEKRRSTHASTSSVSTDGGSKKTPSVFEGTGPGVSLLKIQRSTWHTETDPPIYTYEKLKITNFDLPRDVDINRLEIHLSKEEFEDIFKQTREEFYKMAEWKRNDIKRRNNLY